MTIINVEKVGSVRDIEKLKKVLLYLISHLDSAKYKTELIKLSFILDYKYSKAFNSEQNATTVEYVKYNYGPYSESFVDAFEQLKNEGTIVDVSLPFGAGFALGKEINSNGLDEKIKMIIDDVIKEYGKKPLREMKSFIYDLDEFKRTEFGKPIALN